MSPEEAILIEEKLPRLRAKQKVKAIAEIRLTEGGKGALDKLIFESIGE